MQDFHQHRNDLSPAAGLARGVRARTDNPFAGEFRRQSLLSAAESEGRGRWALGCASAAVVVMVCAAVWLTMP